MKPRKIKEFEPLPTASSLGNLFAQISNEDAEFSFVDNHLAAVEVNIGENTVQYPARVGPPQIVESRNDEQA